MTPSEDSVSSTFLMIFVTVIFLILVLLVDVRLYVSMVFGCVFLITSDAEFPSMFLLVSCVASLEKYLHVCVHPHPQENMV